MTKGFGRTKRAAPSLILCLLCGAAAAPQIGPPIESKFYYLGSPHGELVNIEDGFSCHVQSPFVVSDHFGVTAPVILDFENRGEARTIEVLFRSYGECSFTAVFTSLSSAGLKALPVILRYRCNSSSTKGLMLTGRSICGCLPLRNRSMSAR